jgi:hypothetical protein
VATFLIIQDWKQEVIWVIKKCWESQQSRNAMSVISAAISLENKLIIICVLLLISRQCDKYPA